MSNRKQKNEEIKEAPICHGKPMEIKANVNWFHPLFQCKKCGGYMYE